MIIRTALATAAAASIGSPAASNCIAVGEHKAETLRQICDLERAWGQSFVSSDATAARRMLAEDFIGVSTKGKQYRKADEIADISKPSHMASDVLNDVIVRFYGDTAIAQGSDSWIDRNRHKGRFVWTDVWVKRNGSWQIVAAEDLIPPESK